VYKIVDNNPSTIIELRALKECHIHSGIVLAEKDSVQDILTYNDGKFSWASLYLNPTRNRNKFLDVETAIKSRLEKGMEVYVFQNRGEFRDFLKYNGTRKF